MGGPAKDNVAPVASRFDHIDSIIFNAKKAQTQKEKKQSFTGYALYSTPMTKAEFEKKFDQDFIDSVYGNKEDIGSITRVIVYVDELCAYFPQPSKAGLELISKPVAQGTGKKEPDDKKKLRKKTLERIDRFPKGYLASSDSVAFGIMKKVTIEFQREYDYSSGVIHQ